MPNLRLTDQESKDITAYLLSFKNEDFDKVNSLDVNEEELKNIAKRWLVKSFPVNEANNKLDSMSKEEIADYVAKKSINYYGC